MRIWNRGPDPEEMQSEFVEVAKRYSERVVPVRQCVGHFAWRDAPETFWPLVTSFIEERGSVPANLGPSLS